MNMSILGKDLQAAIEAWRASRDVCHEVEPADGRFAPEIAEVEPAILSGQICPTSRQCKGSDAAQ